MGAAHHIRSVEHLGEHRLRITFADGLVSDIDLAERFVGNVGPMIEPLPEAGYFALASVDDESGTTVWSKRSGPRAGRSP